MNLSQIRTKVRRKLDETTEQFWTDDELNDYINDAYYYYWQWMLDSAYYGCITTDTLDIVSGTATVALPTDFHSLRLLERVIDTVTIPLEYFERSETANYTGGIASNSYYGYLPKYRFQGANLVLEPTPQESATDGLKVTYFFIPDRLSSDSDEPNTAFKDFYHELIIGRAVILAKEKEEMVGGGGTDLGPSFLRTQQEREQKFKETIEVPSMQRLYVEPFG